MINNIRKNLLKEIDKKIEKRKELRNRPTSKIVNSFVMSFIKNIEDLNAVSSMNDYERELLFDRGIAVLLGNIQIIDLNAKIDVTLTSDGRQVDNVLIIWSKDFQEKNKCEAQQVIDAASCYIDNLE